MQYSSVNQHVNDAINLRLALIGAPYPHEDANATQTQLVEPIFARQREMNRLLDHRLCPADQRVQNWLDEYLKDEEVKPQIPRRSVVLDQPGLARGLSLPVHGDEFHSPWLESYRVQQGVLHNPMNDRRTTAGVFHLAESALPIPDDKLICPRSVFAKLLQAAFNPPQDLLRLPYTSEEPEQAACWVSLLMRPLVIPAVPGRTHEKRMETRFFTPGGLVCNLDFVEGIFGNAGDPMLPQNDSALDTLGWTGHTGFVVLAPHLTSLTKKELGLPHWDDATERQRRDGMCWQSETDLYNDGKAFKVCARDDKGIVVTIIADNYFGYCKKEIKTQISYSSNLMGCSEEEHSGGALCFPAYNLGHDFLDIYTPSDYTVADVVARNPETFEVQPDGYALFTDDPHTILVPGGANYDLTNRRITWELDGTQREIKLQAGKTYITPSGYRVYAKHREEDATAWHLVGVSPQATQAHKPATVSGGGKSEISKSLLDAFQYGTSFVGDFDVDIKEVENLLARDYQNRFADPSRNGVDHRPILSPERSLGSVIKLLTPRAEYSDDYNNFLRSIPSYIKELIFTIKRDFRPEWKGWREHFSVDVTNGRWGNALRLDGEKIMVNMLRVGFEPDGSWRLFSLRPDFSPVIKVQTEDDISASTVCRPWDDADGLPRKYVANCEMLLFQRPDDAVVRGYDKQAERDLSTPGTFISNFEPLTPAAAREILEDVQAFSEYTAPMQEVIRKAAATPDDANPKFFVCSSMSRLVDGKRSKNPRYLQNRPDVANPRATELASLATHLYRKVPLEAAAPWPVDIVAAGRRNNPPEDGVPALCAYNPLHFMELPELLMEFISSMTGKSPSTTGAGSEGAMTKGPFNMLPTVYDLNTALLSFALTGYDGWLSSAGFIGPHVEVAHDISMLIPELFARMTPQERDSKALIEGEFLEKIEDYEYEGRLIRASRLGYRINTRFVTHYFARIFLHPDMVFPENMLHPEIQDPKIFADSIDVIVKTHERVAKMYFEDGTVELACPPLRKLLEIMAYGKTEEGWGLDTPDFRQMFTRDAIVNSDWYQARLDAQQQGEIALTKASCEALKAFIDSPSNSEVVTALGLEERLDTAEDYLAQVSSTQYRENLAGTTGREVRFL